MRDGDKNKIADELHRIVTDYMRTPEFEARAMAACVEIERGGLRTDAELAAALGVPVFLLDFARRQQMANVGSGSGLQ